MQQLALLDIYDGCSHGHGTMSTETEQFRVSSVNSERNTRLHILDDISLKAFYRFVDYLACLTPITYFEVIFPKASRSSSYQVKCFL